MNTKSNPVELFCRESLHKIQDRPTKLWKVILSILLISGILLGCSLFSNFQTSDEDSSVLLTEAGKAYQQTLEIMHIQATHTALVEQLNAPSITPSPSLTFTPIPPTSTSSPSPTPTSTNKSPTQTISVGTSKIRFRTGGTSAYFQKAIEAGDSQVYTVRALAGQTMILTVSSPGNDVYFTAKGFDDGVWLFDPSTPLSYWTGSLPKSQPYQIDLMTDNPATTYFLSVEVPANILFATGTYSDTVTGYVDVDTQFHPGVLTRVRYLARASAGQTMTVTLSSPNLDDLSLGIIGQGDGQEYLDYQVKNNGATFVLPVSQGYFLDVYAVNGVSTEFKLELIIK